MNGGGHNPSFVKIYKDLLQIKNARKRADMMRMLMVDDKYKAAARDMGLYTHFLTYIARVDAGQVPSPLPGETAAAPQQPPARPNALMPFQQEPARGYSDRPAAVITKGRRNEKALTYFQSCLQVLGLEEEVALTDDALKKAYKRAAVKAHPDKGGSEQDFEAVTRAHAYLGEILRRINGGGALAAAPPNPSGGYGSSQGQLQLTDAGHAPNVTAMQMSRAQEEKRWESMEPVRLNPKKLDLDAFNKMFEQTRIPDPDGDGYGDWLKKADDAAAPTGPKFSGKFNRDVFNQAFEEEARRGAGGANRFSDPEALSLAPSAVEVGRGRPTSYTAAMNADLHFTDLRNAFTTDNMITTHVADVRVEDRNFEKYTAQYKAAPAALTREQVQALEVAKAREEAYERERAARAEQELSTADSYFERMKRLVTTNK
jgi:curved DNA-binding protein CbpA